MDEYAGIDRFRSVLARAFSMVESAIASGGDIVTKGRAVRQAKDILRQYFANDCW